MRERHKSILTFPNEVITMFNTAKVLFTIGLSTLLIQSANAVPVPTITVCESNPKLIYVKFNHAPFERQWRSCSVAYHENLRFSDCQLLPKQRFSPCIKKAKKQRAIIAIPKPFIPN